MSAAAIELGPETDTPVADVVASIRRRIVAPVAIGGLLERLDKLTAIGADIARLIKRVALALLRRLARLFGLGLEERGLIDDTPASKTRARFTADDPDMQPVAQEASQLATAQLKAWVDEVLETPAKDWLIRLQEQGGGAHAFLILSLDRLSEQISLNADELQRLTASLAQELNQAASRLGVPPSALRKLLAGGKASSLVNGDKGLVQLRQALGREAEQNAHEVRLLMAFSDQCVAAIQVDAEGLGIVAKDKAQSLANPAVWDAVNMALASQFNGEPHCGRFPPQEARIDLNSAFSETGLSRAHRFSGGRAFDSSAAVPCRSDLDEDPVLEVDQQEYLRQR